MHRLVGCVLFLSFPLGFDRLVDGKGDHVRGLLVGGIAR